jgi:hypothetical protein
MWWSNARIWWPISETAVGILLFFRLTGAPRKSTKSLLEVRWGGLGVAQRRQGRSRGACGSRDGSGLVLMGPRHATGGHMCHGPVRPSGVKPAPPRPPEPRMPARGPTSEPLSATHICCDQPTRFGAAHAPWATMVSQLPWQLDFSCNQLAIPVHVDGPEHLSTNWGRWVVPSQSEHSPTSTWR